MIEIIKELKIEVSKPNIFQAVVAKQYDMNTRFIKATFVDGSDIISIPAVPTVKAIINAERPDGQSQGFEGVINDDGTVTVPIHSWMLELDGTVICDISTIDTTEGNNKKLTTTAFTLLVEKASYGGDDISSDPQYDILIELLNSCSMAEETAQEALDKSNEALAKSASANEKYDACVEATANANNVLQDIQAGGYIESLKEINNGAKFCVWIGTQAEKDALLEERGNCLYIVTDDTYIEDLKIQQDNDKQRIDTLEDSFDKLNKILYEPDDEYIASVGEDNPIFNEDLIATLKTYNHILMDIKTQHFNVAEGIWNSVYNTIMLQKRRYSRLGTIYCGFYGSFVRDIYSYAKGTYTTGTMIVLLEFKNTNADKIAVRIGFANGVEYMNEPDTLKSEGDMNIIRIIGLS